MSKAKSTEPVVEAEAVEEVIEPKAEPKAKTETVVYVGPTIPGVASHNTVFNNGLTEEMKAAIEREPAFANLVVPIKRLAQAGQDIANKSGATYVFYEKAMEYKA